MKTLSLIFIFLMAFIQNVWAECHIAVLPSYREGLPKSLLEAGSCGRPIITTDVPGCREVVNGFNGLLVPPKNSGDLFDAIVTLSQDIDMIKRLGSESRRLIEASFSSQKVNAEMLNIYKEE